MKTAISVIGLGKLGLCTAACLAKAGFEITGMDIREDYVQSLQAGKVPFQETGLSELLVQTRKKLRFTTSLAEAFQVSDASFIIVPTPSLADGAFNNEYILAVLQELGPLLAGKNAFHLINVVSTVMPGSSQDTFIPLLERLSGKTAGTGFGFAYNPEFIAIGSVIENFLNPDLVLIGESDQRTGRILEEIYAATCANQPHMAHTSLINAEIAKLALNCYCTMKISFANNLAAICDHVPDAEAEKICQILGQDSRIGGKYIKPGLGFGGPCFPRDNEAYIKFLEKSGGYKGLQEAVITINDRQTQRAVKKILQSARKVGGKVALLGISYKPDTYLTERSQALEIAEVLAQDSSVKELRIYDPLATAKGNWLQTEGLIGCVKDANVVAILTPWPEFRARGWENLLSNPHEILDFWKQEKQ